MEGQRGDMGERFSSELSVVKRGAMAFRFALDGLLFFYTFLTSQPLSEALDPNHPTDRSGICFLFNPRAFSLNPFPLMDYDRNDALLHWLFRQTQGDAWFRPNEENISSGVALRVNDGTFFSFFYCARSPFPA